MRRRGRGKHLDLKGHWNEGSGVIDRRITRGRERRKGEKPEYN